MRLRTVVTLAAVLSGFLVLPAHASCSVSGVRGRDPGRAAINAEIDRAASRRQVPPYLLKSLAWHESRWAQFYADGRPVLSSRCAIGVMQVLASGGFSAYKLATDYRYNIDAGAQVIAAKMSASSNNVPSSLGADDRRVAENWYRAAYRYLGAGYSAMRYADKVFATIVNPPSETRPWVVPVNVVNPRNVVRGYTPYSGHAYVARADGTWVSTLGRYTHRITRADWLAGSARMTRGATLEGDQRWSVNFYARNLGWRTWQGDRVTLSTYPLGRASRLRHPSWRTATRPVGVAVTTPPGATAKFAVPVQAARPRSSVTVTETFVPVVDGGLSMVSRAGSTWTLHPAKAPIASITSAPKYLTDQTTDSIGTLSLAFSDPSPGSGIARVELAMLAPGASAWGAPFRTVSPTVRLSFRTAGRHQVRVRAVDRAGHVGAWSTPASVVVPRDNTDASLAFDGTWSAPSVTGSWLGSLAGAEEGASVSVTATGASFALIGTRGPGLAALTVYLDGVLVAVLDTNADTTAHRQVLWEADLTPGEHVLRIAVGDESSVTTASVEPTSAPRVAYLDAIAVV